MNPKILFTSCINWWKKHLALEQEISSSDLSSFRLVTKLSSKIIARIYQKTFTLDQWYLLFDLDNEMSMTFSNFKKCIPPKDRFWADPIVIQKDGIYYVFVEEYIYKSKKAHISCFTLDNQVSIKGPDRVLEKEYHLSYPFVFEWDGKFYMVPESVANKTISLYECIDFPYSWKFKLDLMKNILAVDTTLLHHQAKWWLFTGIPTDESSLPLVQLFLFYTDDLFSGEWSPHPQNPIVSDVKRARPAGGFFFQNGKIFRPSQNCSKTYGYGFDINEIVMLSESAYSEKQVVSTIPNWDKKVEATHTFAHQGQLTVIDAFMRRRRLF